MIKTLTVKTYTPEVGKILLVHDGEKILAMHGPEAETGSGNPKAKFIVGPKEEVDGEITRLNLKANTENV